MVKKFETINILLMCCLAPGYAIAQDMSTDPASIKPPPAEYSPYLQHHYPDRVFFGDTHVHTSFSTDAGLKGWLDAKGELHEKVYDVAWSGDRELAADGKLPAVGNTVNVADAYYTNTIGEPMLFAYWKDPAFNSKESAYTSPIWYTP